MLLVRKQNSTKCKIPSNSELTYECTRIAIRFWDWRAERKTPKAAGMKYWEIIADNLSDAGWSWGYVSALDSEGRTIWIADAHREDGKRFIVRADEKLTAFLELERAVCVGLLTEQI